MARPVDQRRKADQRLAALAQLHQLRQLAEGPGGVAHRSAATARSAAEGACLPDDGRRSLRRPAGDRSAPAARRRSAWRQLQRRQRLERRARQAAELGLQRGQVAPDAELAAVLVDDAQVHQQMRRQLLLLEVGALDVEAGLRRAPRLSSASTRLPSPNGVAAMNASANSGSGTQARARPLVQRLQQRDHLVLQHAGHQPLAAVLARLVERIDRHGHGDAVLRVAGLVQVGRRAVDAAEADRASGTPRW